MMSYFRLNNLTGWLVFLTALTVYVLTLEPTASFWDSGEFIATAYTLGVPHAPGAPVYLLLGRLFSFLALGDTLQVAYWVNMLSALCSAFTVLFLFWTITLLGRRLLGIEESPHRRQTVLLLGSGVVGALAFAFSDSFWFSAVEAEVYAMASLLMAFCFWVILRWANADTVTGYRWLILIAYVLGLSVGVHILVLLVIPALAMVYYYRTSSAPSQKGLLIALATGGGLLLLVMLGLGWIGGLAATADIFLVNQAGLPFGSGLVLVGTLLFGGLGYGLYDAHRRQKAALSAAWLSVAFIFIGYASYALIPIRAKAQTPINLNNPDNIVSFIGYLNREQYPTRPLLYGPDFTAKPIEQRRGAPIYTPGDSEYTVKNHRIEPVYDPKAQTLLPRLYSDDPGHPELYRQWTDLSPGESPTFADNWQFLFRFQLGHMYVRYFLWNFAGRESGRQDAGWLTPWESTQAVPAMIRDNRARNQYWMLPLLLGVVGLVFQYRRHRSDAIVLLTLFFMTGVALVLYTNNPPVEPRERDYVYVGNFYAFAIWIGLGVIGVGEMVAYWGRKLFRKFRVISKNYSNLFKAKLLPGLRPGKQHTRGFQPRMELPRRADRVRIYGAYRFLESVRERFIRTALDLKLRRKTQYASVLLPCLTVLACLSVPLLMASENWDDHDRSGRYFSVDAARNMLASCDENAILFTGGDNDTYPLWYVQNVEGFRTDVRVMVTTFSNVDWYIEAMKRHQYASDPLPLSLSQHQYRQGGPNDYLPYVENPNVKGAIRVNQYLKLIRKDSPALQVNTAFGKINTIPAQAVFFEVDKEQVQQEEVMPTDENEIASRMVWELTARGLEKKDLLLLDLVETNDWQRPIYFNNTSLNSINFDLRNYTIQEGDTFRLIPVENPDSEAPMVDTDKMYHRMMHEFAWRGLDNPDAYYAGNYLMFVQNQRMNFNILAEALIRKNQREKARQVLSRSLEVMPNAAIPYDVASIRTVSLLLQLGETAQANQVAHTMRIRYDELLTYLAKHPNSLYQREQSIGLFLFDELSRAYAQANDPQRAEAYQRLLTHHYQALSQKI